MEGRFDRILTRSQSKKKRSRPELDDCYRFVCQEVPFDYIDQSHPEYDINLRIVRFELSSGIYENIITNLPEDEFDFEDFLELYFYVGARKIAFGISNIHWLSINFIPKNMLISFRRYGLVLSCTISLLPFSRVFLFISLIQNMNIS